MKWINRLFCHHDYSIFICNIYGDEIHATGGKRSVWKCSKCGKVFYAPHLKEYYDKYK